MYRISETGVNNILVALKSESSNADAISSLITCLLDADHDIWKATWNADPKIGAYEQFARFANRNNPYTMRELVSQLGIAVDRLLMVHHRLLLSEMILYSWRIQHGSRQDPRRNFAFILADQIPEDLANCSKYESVELLYKVLTGEPRPMWILQPKRTLESPFVRRSYAPTMFRYTDILYWIASVLRGVYFGERLKPDQIDDFVHRNILLPAIRISQYQAKSAVGGDTNA